MSSRKLTDEEYAAMLAKRNKRGGRQLSIEEALRLERINSQQGEGEGEIEESFEEHLLASIKDQSQIIQGLIDAQGTQSTINEQMLEIVEKLEARIEKLEEKM